MPERVRAPEPNGAAEHEGLTARAFSFTGDQWADFSLIDRDSLPTGSALAGPALIAEETAMTFLDGGFRASVHSTGSLLIEREAGGGHG